MGKRRLKLVSQDARAVANQAFGAEANQSHEHRQKSFARRSGGWQQCRPPFLLASEIVHAAFSLNPCSSAADR